MTGGQPVSARPHVPPQIRLEALVGWLREQGVDVDATGWSESRQPSISGVTLSSQRVQTGDLYAALPGARAHGMDFAADAVRAGAVAVLTDAAGPELAGALSDGLEVPLLVVAAPRALLGRLAAWLYGEPATSLRMIGVTGTQGKTTCTRLAEGALQGSGIPAAVVGTVGTRVAGVDVRTALTTPEAPDLQALFAVMREEAVSACAMEVSSHALVLGRVDGVVFDVAVFLNLGRDHLDFHADAEEYFAAKASLFTPDRASLGLVNLDDAHGRRLAGQPKIETRTFAMRDDRADWRAVEVDLRADGSTFRVRGPGGVDVVASVPLPGDFNVANALAAIAACAEAGYDPGAVADGIARGGGVPGRLERVDAGQDFVVVVDYAHKPDAVAAAIRTLRPLTAGRVIVVLGAGGDRDQGKRPIMAGIAAEMADVLVISDDNPRTEDPAVIRAAMLAGIDGHVRAQVLEVGDRGAAIVTAIDLAAPGDIVLVAGKGHETGQEIRGVVHPFDDRDVARAAIAERAARETGQ